MLDHGLELSKHSTVSGSRVINTLSSRTEGQMGRLGLSGTIALFTHFSLFFPLFRSLTHIPLSRPVTSQFILIFHPLPRACTHDIQPARRVSFFSLFPDHVIDHLIAMCLPHGFCQERLPRLHIFLCFSLITLLNPHSFITTSYVPIYSYFPSLTVCLYVRYSAH